MKILYLDFLYPKSHMRLDVNHINRLSNIGKVYVLTPKGRYNNLPPGVEVIEMDSLIIKSGKISNRISSLKIMLISSIISHKLKPDYILVSSYETMMFAIGRLFFRKKDKIILFNHFNIDELNNKVKRYFFETYMNKVEHIVFETFIKDYLIKDFNLDENKVHVLPHHMNINLSVNNYDLKYNCVGLSNSNDEKVIADIVNIEKEKELLKKSKRKVILKSQHIKFDNGYLKVINGFLEKDTFEKYINHSQCIYMPFSLTFKYRMSGTLVDAFSNNKIVYGSNILLMEHYSRVYPEICKIINSAEDFFKYVLNMNIMVNNEQVKEFELFKRYHSDEKIENIFKQVFGIDKPYNNKKIK